MGEQTTVSMIVGEGSTKDSCGGYSSLGAREAVAKSYGGNFSRGDLEEVARNYDPLSDEVLESAENFSVGVPPSAAPHRANCIAVELAWCSSCSSSGSRFHVVEVGQEGLGSSTCSWVD